MSSARHNLLRLATDLAAHQGVTHWAISMRMFAKGDFFHKLEMGSQPRMDTYEKALGLFSRNWPEDLEWPQDIQRPETTDRRAS
jgi:hypothetical protein